MAEQKLREGQIYEDVNGVRFIIRKIDKDNDYVEKEVYGSLLFDYGFTGYEFNVSLKSTLEMIKNKKIWYWGDE